ncbi:hypothetical protein QR680_011891 [Steinernema hermaphroditum]|uniref:Uncharacterized protein n=1 Tax=Steinernema hermaphroditum TaxID=289476 RepID=A0AA39I036_9BILA|nr:hypothetical protein QR680_011891 [Steinernema hermaphroditum]
MSFSDDRRPCLFNKGRRNHRSFKVSATIPAACMKYFKNFLLRIMSITAPSIESQHRSTRTQPNRIFSITSTTKRTSRRPYHIRSISILPYMNSFQAKS